MRLRVDHRIAPLNPVRITLHRHNVKGFGLYFGARVEHDNLGLIASANAETAKEAHKRARSAYRRLLRIWQS